MFPPPPEQPTSNAERKRLRNPRRVTARADAQSGTSAAVRRPSTLPRPDAEKAPLRSGDSNARSTAKRFECVCCIRALRFKLLCGIPGGIPHTVSGGLGRAPQVRPTPLHPFGSVCRTPPGLQRRNMKTPPRAYPIFPLRCSSGAGQPFGRHLNRQTLSRGHCCVSANHRRVTS